MRVQYAQRCTVLHAACSHAPCTESAACRHINWRKLLYHPGTEMCPSMSEVTTRAPCALRHSPATYRRHGPCGRASLGTLAFRKPDLTLYRLVISPGLHKQHPIVALPPPLRPNMDTGVHTNPGTHTVYGVQ